MSANRSSRNPLVQYLISYLAVIATILKMTAVVVTLSCGFLIAIYYPRASDKPLSSADMEKLREYYRTAYIDAVSGREVEENPRYFEIARQAAEAFGIRERIEDFVVQYDLKEKKVLDVGAGRGYLQDLVQNYTALDISASARRYFHKPFVLGSATAMPFPDSTFDAAWSIWVLEHVPNPEQALLEMRRVLKNEGLLFLLPAWHCTPFAAQGYPWRPYSDFGFGGKLVKASIPVRVFLAYHAIIPVRLTRHLQWMLQDGRMRLRYGRIEANYDYYWGPDSDAVNSLDQHEVHLWFVSRGDECLNCSGSIHNLLDVPDVLIVRISKAGNGAAQGSG